MTEGVMFLLERSQPNQRRLFVVACDHGHTDVVMSNYPRPDESRGNQVFGNLIDTHKAEMKKLEGELCACQVRRASS